MCQSSFSYLSLKRDYYKNKSSSPVILFSVCMKVTKLIMFLEQV